MTTKIKLTRNTGGHTKGDTITVTPKAADYLVEQGYAEEVKPTRTKKTDTDGGGGDSSAT